MESLQAEAARVERQVSAWAGLFAEDVDFDQFFSVQEIQTETGNITGIDIPVYAGVAFEEAEYDFYTTPLWVDRAIEVCKEQIKRHAEAAVCRRQREILQEELRITIQRIKLFEEVKIPEARENIRVIQIFLGDQMTAEVVRGKIAKAKIERKKHEVSRV